MLALQPHTKHRLSFYLFGCSYSVVKGNEAPPRDRPSYEGGMVCVCVCVCVCNSFIHSFTHLFVCIFIH